jgi:hypothetical protein
MTLSALSTCTLHVDNARAMYAQEGGFIYLWRECVKGFYDRKIPASSLFMLANGMW